MALWAATWLVVTAINHCPASPLPGLPDGMVLDEDQPAKSKASIDQAVATNQVDVFFAAMHNHIEVVYCYEKLPLLAKIKQAELLARLLQDESFVESREHLLNHGSNYGNTGAVLRTREITARACQLLGETPRALSTPTRIDLDALATRLRALQR